MAPAPPGGPTARRGMDPDHAARHRGPMNTVVVTGAAGPATERVVASLAACEGVDRVVVVSPRPDPKVRAAVRPGGAVVEVHVADVVAVDLERFLHEASAVVHLGAAVDDLDPALLAEGRIVDEAAAVLRRGGRSSGRPARAGVDRGRLRRLGEQPRAPHRGRGREAAPQRFRLRSSWPRPSGTVRAGPTTTPVHGSPCSRAVVADDHPDWRPRPCARRCRCPSPTATPPRSTSTPTTWVRPSCWRWPVKLTGC